MMKDEPPPKDIFELKTFALSFDSNDSDEIQRTINLSCVCLSNGSCAARKLTYLHHLYSSVSHHHHCHHCFSQIESQRITISSAAIMIELKIKLFHFGHSYGFI